MIYLDYNATHPTRPEVVEAMAPWWGVPANASSVHQAGQRARSAVERARRQVAGLLGRPPQGIVFTSGATEANATWWAAQVALGRSVVAMSALEHPSSRGAAERSGVRLHHLSVGADGRAVLPNPWPAEIDAISLMAANHETGVLQPYAAAIASGRPVHVDATQALGRVDLDLSGAEAVCFSAHKLGGPPGVGVLSLPSADDFPSLIPGAQERGRRGGTENVPGIVGLGVACALAQKDRHASTQRARAAQERLEAGLRELGATIVGGGVPRVPQTTCAVFAGLPGELVVQALDLRGFAVSSGAACASGSTEPSPVLLAMGHPHPEASVRFSASGDTTAAEVDAVLAALGSALPSLRELSGDTVHTSPSGSLL